MEKILDFLNTDIDTFVGSLKDILITVITVVLIVYLINLILKKTQKKLERNGQSATAVKVVRYALLVLVIIAAASQIISSIPTLNSFMSTLLAGSGIAAVVLSVAAQEPISNMVSGLIIMVSKPFRVGDIIRYIDQDISGVVEEITLRHTVVRTFENKRLIIPNGTINNCAIENSNYAEDKICMLLDFTITYESDAEKAMRIISDVVLLHPDYCDNRTEAEINEGSPPVKILVIRFDPSSVVIRAWVWAASTTISINMKSDILLGVQRRFGQEGVEFAYPHTELVIKEKNHPTGI